MLKAFEIISTARYRMAFLRLKTISSYIFIYQELSIKMNVQNTKCFSGIFISRIHKNILNMQLIQGPN